jgi:signal peptidase I
MDNNFDNGSFTEEPENELKPCRFSRFFEWIELFTLCFAVGLIVLLLFFRHSPVIGSSMYPTLNEGDILIVSTFNYTPKNGDVVVCQSESYGLETPLVKRVIATEGQTVSIDYESWTVTVDGVILNEDYINRLNVPMDPSNYLPNTFTVPENHIFVMGDNRNASSDSRNARIGFIDERYVLGKVSARFLPISKFRIF